VGDRNAPRRPLAWQNTLGEMKAHGTMIAQTTGCTCRGRWLVLNVDVLIHAYGSDFVLWDRPAHCAVCGKVGHYMASPTEGTPMRPLQTNVSQQVLHREFVLSFGFTKRDATRIKAMAERTTSGSLPVALNDLDVPYRVGACMLGEERHSSGLVLGEWQGRALLYWQMTGAELLHWRNRRGGPRPV
jgi:hypothetical protein